MVSKWPLCGQSLWTRWRGHVSPFDVDHLFLSMFLWKSLMNKTLLLEDGVDVVAERTIDDPTLLRHQSVDVVDAFVVGQVVANDIFDVVCLVVVAAIVAIDGVSIFPWRCCCLCCCWCCWCCRSILSCRCCRGSGCCRPRCDSNIGNCSTRCSGRFWCASCQW